MVRPALSTVPAALKLERSYWLYLTFTAVLALPLVILHGNRGDWLAAGIYLSLIALGRSIAQRWARAGQALPLLGALLFGVAYLSWPESLPTRLAPGVFEQVALLSLPGLGLIVLWGLRALPLMLLPLFLLTGNADEELLVGYHLVVTALGGLLVHRFVRHLERVHGDLVAAALTDHLTGLGNRRALASDYQHYQGHALRYGESFILSAWDLDGLKRVNDLQGHAAGDKHLRTFTECLKRHSRADDKFYRLGGDEFVGLHLGMTSGASLYQRVMQDFPYVSAGWTRVGDELLDQALMEADISMYEEKTSKAEAVLRSVRTDEEHHRAPV